MTADIWRYTFASVTGTSHLKTGTACQDVSACAVLQAFDGEPALVAVASDGAGSARLGLEGAQLTCDHFFRAIRQYLRNAPLGSLTRDTVAGWIAEYGSTVQELARSVDARPRDYASTLLAVAVGERTAAFVQVGDGAIVVPNEDSPDEYCHVFWPHKGEYENQTSFVTDPDAVGLTQFMLSKRRIDEVSLLTDGLQRLALHYQTQSAYSPFFRTMLAPVRGASGGHAEGLSQSLAAFLATPPVTARTDDDKTLVLASRRRTILQDGNEQVNHDEPLD